MTNQPVIRAEHVSIEYRLNGHWLNAVNDITLEIAPLEIHGLVGESGSGKSTLALALMRYLAPNARFASGRVLLDGDDLVPKPLSAMQQIWGRSISYVPQNPATALNPAYPVGEQIAEITRRHEGLSRKESLARAVELLRRVKIADPDVVARRYPHQLSGGMGQRVAIAMALSTQPRLLILDEPTTALDVTTRAVILDLFRELIHENHAAALYVSHDLATVAQLCDRVTVLYGGEIMASGDVKLIYARPIHPYTAGLIASLPHRTRGLSETRLRTIEGVAPSLAERPTGCVFAPRCPAAIDLCHSDKPALEALPDGRVVRCHRWREIDSGAIPFPIAPVGQPAEPRAARESDARPVLVTRGVGKRFREGGLMRRLMRKPPLEVRAVDDVSLKVNARSTLGLVGESGSGKTTLARCIVALESADSGTMELCDVPLHPRLSQRPREVLRELQMVFQTSNDALNPYHSVGETLTRTLKLLSAEKLTRAQIRERVAALLAAVRLPESYAQRYPTELSGGERQRVAIARAFAANPALVVADEPTSALDVSVQAVILNLLKDLRATQGASYLFISHDLDVIAYLAEWICVMYLGEIVEQGTTEDVYGIPSHPYTEALISAIPSADPQESRKHIRLEGDAPSARNLPTGCRFHTRCPRKIGAVCEQEPPPWRDAGGGHFIRCHIPIEELKVMQARDLAVRGEAS